MEALRAGDYLPPADDSYDPMADMKAHESTHKRRAVERETYMSKEQLMELRKVQNERIEVRHSYTESDPRERRSCWSYAGGKDEAAWDGHQAEHGRPHGRDHVRWLSALYMVGYRRTSALPLVDRVELSACIAWCIVVVLPPLHSPKTILDNDVP